jgi:hypothetical protein
MNLEQLKLNLEAVKQQAYRLDGMMQLLTQMIEQAEAATKAALAEAKD